jgi:chromosome segregation ATPase
MFGNAQKQFRLITEISEKRQEERTKLDLQLAAVAGKLNKEKKEVKSLRKKKQTLETQIEKCQDDIVELKKEVVCLRIRLRIERHCIHKELT